VRPSSQAQKTEAQNLRDPEAKTVSGMLEFLRNEIASALPDALSLVNALSIEMQSKLLRARVHAFRHGRTKHQKVQIQL
jgi:hypothetical protein